MISFTAAALVAGLAFAVSVLAKAFGSR